MARRYSSALRSIVALALAAALIGSVAATPALARTRRDPMPVTPGGKLQVIVENLREWFDGPDDIFGNSTTTGCVDIVSYPRCGREMLNLARHMSNRLSTAPDVLLLEEAFNKSLQLLVHYMDRFIGHNYALVEIPDPTRRFVTINGHHYRITSNTAIIINTDAMKVLDPGGYLRVHQKPKDQLVGDPKNKYPLLGQREAYIQLAQRSTGLTVAATALHFATFHAFAITHQGQQRKLEWSQKVLKHLYAAYPDQDLYLFGGELNNRRCKKAPETVNCDSSDKDHIMPFWTAFTGAPYNLKDTVWWKHNSSDQALLPQVKSRNGSDRRVDYTFTSGHVYHATRDLSYDVDPYRVTHSVQKSWHYISDHRWVSSLIGLPPSKINIRRVVVEKRIGVFGRTRSSHVRGVLFAKRNGVWERVAGKRSETVNRHFSFDFMHPDKTRRCMVRVGFKGDRQYAADKDIRRFSC